MAEYADMHIDDTLSDYVDRTQGWGIYEEGIISEWDSDDEPVPVVSQFSTWKVREILHETEKSRLIVSDKTGNTFWVSKKLSILKNGFLFIQKWYAVKLIPLPKTEFEQLLLTFEE